MPDAVHDPPHPGDDPLGRARRRALTGGVAKYHQAKAAKGKFLVRTRIDRLVDAGSFREDGLLSNALADGLPADGVITGSGTVTGQRS